MIEQSLLTARPLRVLVVWCPQWVLRTALWVQQIPAGEPVVVTDRGLVVACSESAAAEGISVGLKVRQAQHRCPGLLVLAEDVDQQARCFEPVLAALADVVPLARAIRPGVAAVRSSGGERFYGGGQEFLDRVMSRLRADPALAPLVPDPRAGIADGLFAAEQAARGTSAQAPTAIVGRGESAAFLAPLPVGSLPAGAGFAPLLHRMGVRTLGDLAALDRSQVFARFGPAGLRAHRLACGEDTPVLSADAPPPDFDLTVDFGAELATVEQICASAANGIERFVTRISDAGLICHQLRISLLSEDNPTIERVWRHPWEFTAGDIADRLRWQLTDDARWGCSGVRFSPLAVDPIGDHAAGLWGDRPSEYVMTIVSRLQHRLGHHGVRVGAVVGGRLLTERRVTQPWGDRLPDARTSRLDQPWPGFLPGPAPATVFHRPRPLVVLDAAGAVVTIDDRGRLSAAPNRVGEPDRPHQPITAWAGPWPIRQRWWQRAQALYRFQFVTDQQAWVAINSPTRWWAEARYD